MQSKSQRFSPSSQLISTPTSSVSGQSPIKNVSPSNSPSKSPQSFTKIKSRQPFEHTTPTQNIVDDEDDWKSSIVSKAKSPRETVSKDSLSASYGRHLVEGVAFDENGRGGMILTLRDLNKDSAGNGSCTRICRLMGTWIDTRIRQGDIVNILGIDKDNKDWVVDDLNGLLVVNPDMLISGTSIVSTLFCMRKAVLNERFKVYFFLKWKFFLK